MRDGLEIRSKLAKIKIYRMNEQFHILDKLFLKMHNGLIFMIKREKIRWKLTLVKLYPAVINHIQVMQSVKKLLFSRSLLVHSCAL